MDGSIASFLIFRELASYRGRRQMGPWARHLLFVEWSKIQALFSPRHSKDKASGKSWALLKQRDKVPTPEVKEDFPVCAWARSLLEGQKRKGLPPHPIISVDMHPQASGVGSILEKSRACILGRVQGPVKWGKKQDNWPKVNKDPDGLSCISDLHHLLIVFHLIQDAHTPLWVFNSG